MLRRSICSKGKTFKIYMVRHGQSEWNLTNLFCGWYDADLTDLGIEEAKRAGRALKEKCICFDLCYSSMLKRANHTLYYILQQMDSLNVAVRRSWRLNERHYGALTGLNKAETVEKYGMDKVKAWRRSYDIPPPPMDPKHPYYDSIVNSPIYANGPSKEEFPMFESLKTTEERTKPFWDQCIVPEIKCNRKILIAAHGNSLRAIVKMLDDIPNDKITELNIPTGIPFEYTLDECMKPLPGCSLQYIGDPEMIKKAIESVKGQIEKKK